MAYKGKFKPRNPEKYKGDPRKIRYLSSWELRVMIYFDRNDSILAWSSEEIEVPYRSPIDGKWHRYYPDFLIKVVDRQGVPKVMMIEVKPLKQTVAPVVRKRRTKKYIREVATWGINKSKWDAARDYCADRNWQFSLLTEKDLGI